MKGVKVFRDVMPICLSVAKLNITSNKTQTSNLFQNMIMYSNSVYF
jgi:hypothetical protein